LVLLERSEPQLFAIHSELVNRELDFNLVPCLADIGDRERIDAVFSGYRPHVIFHAAAYKHVPMLEWNSVEAVKNNVIGTRTLAEAADRYGVETFVMLSTDKAVNPTSIMGATKRVAEMLLQTMSRHSETRYVSVRFGNVLASVGSVVPTFKRQIAAGGPVTVTHPEMKRYFMTIAEASQLVLLAGSMGSGGEIFVLDMGEPVKIVDLAADLIKLSGLEPHRDIPITFTGIRPGEKLFEELGFDPRQMERTLHAKIFVLNEQCLSDEAMAFRVGRLSSSLQTDSADQLRTVLESIVPEMQSASETGFVETREKQPLFVSL
jgi:FlaA1/EpsC-like NDP-sugar epimerase